MMLGHLYVYIMEEPFVFHYTLISKFLCVPKGTENRILPLPQCKVEHRRREGGKEREKEMGKRERGGGRRKRDRERQVKGTGVMERERKEGEGKKEKNTGERENIYVASNWQQALCITYWK